jgi:hypothetical protein
MRFSRDLLCLLALAAPVAAIIGPTTDEDDEQKQTGNPGNNLFPGTPVVMPDGSVSTSPADDEDPHRFIISVKQADHFRGRNLAPGTTNPAIANVQRRVESVGGKTVKTIGQLGIVVAEFPHSSSAMWAQTSLMSSEVMKVELDQKRALTDIAGARSTGSAQHKRRLEEAANPEVEQVIP